MQIAIIGSGFTGLAAAYYLSQKKGVKITLFEKNKEAGGLASSYKKENWQWPLEKYYHHLFRSDKDVLHLAKEINHPIVFVKSKTSLLLKNKILDLDSPLDLFLLPDLKIIDKLRTGFVLAYLKTTPFWQPLEKTTSEIFLAKTMGWNAWEMLWQPLFQKKFNHHAKNVPASWFWARIKKRSVLLGYPQGGFQSLIETIIKKLPSPVKINYQTEITKIQAKTSGLKLFYKKENKKESCGIYDKVISTTALPVFLKMIDNPSIMLEKETLGLSEMGTVSLILRLKKPFLPDNIYWLNINNKKFPFLAIVEHTNFIPKKYYQDEHLIYVGQYLLPNNKLFSATAKEVLSIYDPFLTKINTDYKKSLIGFDLFKTPFAQPLIPTNYSSILPPIKTTIPGLYLATTQHVYPWDRGINYAVKLGKKVAKIVSNEKA